MAQIARVSSGSYGYILVARHTNLILFSVNDASHAFLKNGWLMTVQIYLLGLVLWQNNLIIPENMPYSVVKIIQRPKAVFDL